MRYLWRWYHKSHSYGINLELKYRFFPLKYNDYKRKNPEELMDEKLSFEKVTRIYKSLVLLLSPVWLFLWPQVPPTVGFSRQEYWSGCHFLLQGIFPTQGLNPGLPHCRQTLYHLSHQGSHLKKSPQTYKSNIFYKTRFNKIRWLLQ